MVRVTFLRLYLTLQCHFQCGCEVSRNVTRPDASYKPISHIEDGVIFQK